jgi:hypothetical protein
VRRIQYRHVTPTSALAVTAVGVVLWGIAGCASSDAPEGSVWTPSSISEARLIAEENGLEWEIDVLRDGRISASEYEEGYDRYMKCNRDLGYVFDKPKYLDPIEGQVWRSIGAYEGVGEAPEPDMVACENRLSVIETPYVLTTPKRMDPKLLARFRECLDEAGIAYGGNELNYNDFTEDLSDQEFGSGPEWNCLVESTRETFPDVIAFGVGR